MYASVTTTQIKPGQIDDLVSAWDRLLKPEISKLPGIVDAYTLVNRDTHKSLTIVIYATEADATATQTNGTYRALITQIADFLILDTLVREGYEVGSRL